MRTKQYGQIDTEFTARRSYIDALSYARLLTKRNVAFHRRPTADRDV